MTWPLVAVDADELLQNFKNVAFSRQSPEVSNGSETRLELSRGERWSGDISWFPDLEMGSVSLSQSMELLDQMLLDGLSCRPDVLGEHAKEDDPGCFLHK